MVPLTILCIINAVALFVYMHYNEGDKKKMSDQNQVFEEKLSTVEQDVKDLNAKIDVHVSDENTQLAAFKSEIESLKAENAANPHVNLDGAISRLGAIHEGLTTSNQKLSVTSPPDDSGSSDSTPAG